MAEDEAPQSPWCLPALFNYPQLIHTPPQVESLMRCFYFDVDSNASVEKQTVSTQV